MNVRTVKTILWFLLGAGLTVILLRIIHGPGSVVALTDLMPGMAVRVLVVLAMAKSWAITVGVPQVKRHFDDSLFFQELEGLKVGAG